MDDLDLLKVEHWKPFSAFGLTDPFFTINARTVGNTWIMLVILFIFLIITRFLLHNNKTVRFLVTSFLNSFITLCDQTLGSFSFGHVSFITALFTFIFCANILMIIPFVEEPTQDINTTLALGIISFVYIQVYAIKAHGIIGYLKEYLTPFFLMLPLHIVGKLATIVSMSFRLFGNIFGGATIAHIYFGAIQGSVLWGLLGLVPGMAINIFFGLFEGFLQAFVFTMLSLTYLSIALAHDEPEGAKE